MRLSRPGCYTPNSKLCQRVALLIFPLYIYCCAIVFGSFIMAQRRSVANYVDTTSTDRLPSIKERNSSEASVLALGANNHKHHGSPIVAAAGNGLDSIYEQPQQRRKSFPLQVASGADERELDGDVDDVLLDNDDADLEEYLEYEATLDDNVTLLRNEKKGTTAATATRHERRMQKWKASPFAIGYTEATWMDERTRDSRDRSLPPDDTGCLCCSAQVCPLLGATRLGNMAVLKQSMEYVEMLVPVVEGDDDYVDHETEEANTNQSNAKAGATAAATVSAPQPKMVMRRVARPRLDIIVGPYWPMLCGVTYPLILSVSAWTLYSGLLSAKIPVPWYIWIVFLTLTTSLVVALACTAFRDPGVLLRVRNAEALSHNFSDAASWRWSDMADSYRPRNAWYDSDTAVIVEGFDHTCPWTGTAIGRKNMFAFQMFVCLVFLCLIMDIFILTGTFR